MSVVFTELAPGPMKSVSRDVHLCLLSVRPLLETSIFIGLETPGLRAYRLYWLTIGCFLPRSF